MNEPKRYSGITAVMMARDYYDIPRTADIGFIAHHIILDEGFVAGKYFDSKGNLTEGVGHTGHYIGKNFFLEVLPDFIDDAYRITPLFDQLKPETQIAIVSALYRGDLQLHHKTAALMRDGRWQEAAIEYLDHDEYKRERATDSGIAQR